MIFAWFSVKESDKPADDEHRFGHVKIENVAGSIEALLILAPQSLLRVINPRGWEQRFLALHVE